MPELLEWGEYRKEGSGGKVLPYYGLDTVREAVRRARLAFNRFTGEVRERVVQTILGRIAENCPEGIRVTSQWPKIVLDKDGNIKLVFLEGIPSAEEAGNPTVNLSIAGVGGVASAGAVGTPTITIAAPPEPPENGHFLDTAEKSR